MNGVTNSVLQVLSQLRRGGHEVLVIAPRSGEVTADLHGAHTKLLRSMALPSYPQVRVAIAGAFRLTRILREYAPDVIHLASPAVLGWHGVVAADALRIPAVAIYQTDIPAYVEKYGVPGAAPLVEAHIARLHRRATLTLAPSRSAAAQLEALGIDRVRRWGRGVDLERFSPAARSAQWRDRIAPGEVIVGYAGRLAHEKQVEDLRVLCDIPGVRLVVIGDGPSRAALEATLPGAVFTGFLGGAALAEAIASLDVFVHPGESETFCQTVQEAHASGVPVVATGRGGPLDLITNSVDGWLYRPGDLGELRARVADLAGDAAKRRSFGVAARETVRHRGWDVLCEQLVDHYDEARVLRPIDDALLARGLSRPAAPPVISKSADATPRWRRYVALGDSITEGLCDSSRMPAGAYRGWADRLAHLMRSQHARDGGIRYANLAVRSSRVRDLIDGQLPVALALRPDLVSILIGANDLVGRSVDIPALAAEVETAVRALRADGCEVLLATPFLPRRRAAALVLARRFAAFNSELRGIAAATGARLLDVDALPAVSNLEHWADDRVHLRSSGHRLLAYRAADVLGVPDAEALGELEAALHGGDDGEPEPHRAWLTGHVVPWMWRRLHGRRAGDGLSAKHDGYVTVPAPSARRVVRSR